MIFGCRVTVRVGDGVGVNANEGTGVCVAGELVDEVKVEKAVAVDATVTTVTGSCGMLHAANRPSNKNSNKRSLGTTHLATEQRTSAIVR